MNWALVALCAHFRQVVRDLRKPVEGTPTHSEGAGVQGPPKPQEEDGLYYTASPDWTFSKEWVSK